MKTIFFFGVTLLSTMASASGDRFLSYQENYPKSPHWYEFTSNSSCKEDINPISVQDFVSEKKYQGKSVRIIHIYADSHNKNCKDLISKKETQKVVIPVDPKRTTHVYVTYSSDLEIKSGH